MTVDFKPITTRNIGKDILKRSRNSKSYPHDSHAEAERRTRQRDMIELTGSRRNRKLDKRETG